MPKIRKKTSKRTTTHMREKIKKKVTEAHRKQKKAAKKDVTWKSRVKKDPGIPSLFPYKEEVLQEAMQAKARKEEEKAARKEEAKNMTVASLANNAAQQEAAEPDTDSEDEDSADPEASTSNLKAHARSLRSVISVADILIQVLDARDPLGTRTISLEKEILTHNASHSSKKLVLVLNKIDLAPKENVQAWLTYLRRSFPTLAFRSSTQSQRNNLSSRAQNSTGAAATSASALLTLLKSYARGTSKSLTVGVVGLPNVGKSSLINTLKRSKACSVAPTPGWTKNVQTVVLDGGLKILDCPGVVLDEPTGNVTGDEIAQKVLRSAVEVDKLVDPLTPVELILSKCKHEHLMMLYNIPTFETTQEFLIHVARARGRLRKGGLPDITGSAKSVIRDWTAGRIPYYTVPPPLPTAAPLQDTPMDAPVDASDAIVTSFAPEFDLNALFKSADEEALDGLKGVKESKGVAMKKGGLGMPEGQVKLLGEDQDQSMEAEVPVAAPKSKKRRHVETEPIEQETVSVAPPSKKKAVSFASTQQTRLFTDGETETMGQNKAIAKAAKKDKKRKLKAASGAMDTTEAVAEDPVDALTRGLEARTKSLTFQDEGKLATGGDDDAYDFASFFGREKGLELDQDA